MGAVRFVWSPGEAAAEPGRVIPAAAALAAATFFEGAALKAILERPEFTPAKRTPEQKAADDAKSLQRVEDAPAVKGAWWQVGGSFVAVALLAWFVRSTVLEIALDFNRKQKNMRPVLRATGWITAIAAAAGALWGLLALVAVPKGASPLIFYKEGESWTDATIAPTVWVLTVPFAIFWAWRAFWEGRAAAKLYGKPAPLAVALSFGAGLMALGLAMFIVTTLSAQYDRITHAFSR